MEGIGASITWPTKDPGWIGKCVVIGLITLIPIVGAINLAGWMMTALENLRAGRQELPPAGFGYIGKGLSLFVVYVAYSLVLFVVFFVFVALGAVVGSAGNGNGNPIGALFIVIGYALLFVASLGLALLSPPIISATSRGGIGAGLNLPAHIAKVQAYMSPSLIAGLMIIVASVIGQIGSVLCGIGIFLTLPYGYAIMAAVTYHWESTVSPATGTGMPPQMPPSPAV